MAYLTTERPPTYSIQASVHRRRPWRLALLALLAVLLAPPLLIAYVHLVTLPHRTSAIEETRPAPVAIVFGAGLRPDGTPSPMLADRVEAGVALYQQGRVSRLLMTGDASEPNYDEVGAMRAHAMRLGVPNEAIMLDSAGLNTYQSCYRARSVYAIDEAILVTQDYHLPRAVYSCRQLGIDARGLGTPDWEAYSDEIIRYYVTREMLATLNALVDLHITRPEPRISGPFPGASRSGEPVSGA